MVPFALVTLAAATSAAAEADAVAAATMNADRSTETLLGDDTPADLPPARLDVGVTVSDVSDEALMGLCSAIVRWHLHSYASASSTF